jgi:hypothetical protein
MGSDQEHVDFHGDIHGPVVGHGEQTNIYNIQVGSAAADVIVMLDRADYRIEFLVPSAMQRRAPRSQHQPSYLLDVQREIVPFLLRERDSHQLCHWRDEGDEFSVLLLHGPGGQGKTRLAGHFATESHRAGWAVAQAAEKTTQTPISGKGAATLENGQPLLLVVDYAERWRLPTLVEMVDQLRSHQRDRRVRVLLLARPGHDFWRTVSSEFDRIGVDIADPMPLGDLALSDRERAFNEAVEAFNHELELPQETLPPPDNLTADAYGSILTLHMSALAGVCAGAEGEPPPNKENLSRYLLGHERRYWNAVAQNIGGGQLHWQGRLERTVFVATLFGPLNRMTTARSLLRGAALADGEAEAQEVLAIHGRLYPSPHRRLEAGLTSPGRNDEVLSPLHPDRLGEDFVGQCLHESWARSHVESLLSTATENTFLDSITIRRCLSVLAATAERHDAAKAALFAALEAEPQLASQAPSSVLRLVIDSADDELAQAVDRALPPFSTEVLGAARDLSQRLLDALPSDAQTYQRALRLDNLASRSANCGDRRSAVHLAFEASSILRGITKNDQTHLDDFVRVLNNLGSHLSQVGDKWGSIRFALESAGICRQLAQHHPNYVDILASALNNLGLDFASAGDEWTGLRFAMESTALYRLIAKKDEARLPDLAMALNNLGIRYIQTMQGDAAVRTAEEAVKVYRTLAVRQPESYLHNYAKALGNLGLRYASTRKFPAALDATKWSVAIYLSLREDNPDAFQSDFAFALYAYSWVRMAGASEVNKDELESAMSNILQCITIYQNLTAEFPDEFDDVLESARQTAVALRRLL